jgi:hypothetical protein
MITWPGRAAIAFGSALSTIQLNATANPIAVVDGNIVSGNLTDQSNTAPAQVFNNVVGGNLLCQQDSSITGGGNMAKSKQGQCAEF